MTTNLYSQRTYQEHPIKSWSLEETEFSEEKEFDFDYDDLIVPVYSWPGNKRPEGVWARSLSFGDDYFEKEGEYDIFYVKNGDPEDLNRNGFDRRGMPMVLGSNGTTTIDGYGNNDGEMPTIIIDGNGFLSDRGKNDTYTFEFWFRLAKSSIDPLRIFGPLEDNNTDGVWIKDGIISYVVGGKDYISFNLGHVDSPVLLQLTYTPEKISFIVNGEIVGVKPLNLGSLTFAQTKYLGFYGYDTFSKFEVDVPSLYGYLLPEFLCKRRYVWGQGTEEIDVLNDTFLGDAVVSDFSSTESFASLAYPRNMVWEAGRSDNISYSHSKLEFPTRPLPVVSFSSGLTKDEWFDALEKYNQDTPTPVFRFGSDIYAIDDIGETESLTDGKGLGDLRYVRFDFLSNFVSDLRGMFIDFQVEEGEVFTLSSSQYLSRNIKGYVQGDEFRVEYRDSSVNVAKQIFPVPGSQVIDNVQRQRVRLYFDFKLFLYNDSVWPEDLDEILPDLKAMLSDTSSLNLIVGSEDETSFDGNQYCFPNNFCQYDLLAESFCAEEGDPLIQPSDYFCDSFKDYDSLADNVRHDCGGIEYPPFLEGDRNTYENLSECVSTGFVGNLYSVGFSSEENHKMNLLGTGKAIANIPVDSDQDQYSILTYTWRPVNEFVYFTDDVFSKGYWEDYMPLSTLASEQDGVLGLDNVQFNVSQPRHSVSDVISQNLFADVDTADVECSTCGETLCPDSAGGLCNYKIIYCSGCDCSGTSFPSYSDLQSFSFYSEIPETCQYLAPQNSAVVLVKLWKNNESYIYEEESNGVSRPSPDAIAEFPFPYIEDVNSVDVSEGSADGTTAMYQVVDGTSILFDELNSIPDADLSNYKLSVHVELTSRGNTIEPASLSQLEFVSYNKDFDSGEEPQEGVTFEELAKNAPIKTKTGKEIIPVATKSMRVGKTSFPYLTRYRETGFVSEQIDEEDWGYQITDDQFCHSFQFFVRRNEPSIVEGVLARVVSKNVVSDTGIAESIDVKIEPYEQDETKGRIFIETTFENSIFSLLKNGEQVDEVIIDTFQWNCISVVFNEAVHIDEVLLGHYYVFDNISYFLDPARADENCPELGLYCYYSSLAFSCENPLCSSSICTYTELESGSSFDGNPETPNRYSQFISPCVDDEDFANNYVSTYSSQQDGVDSMSRLFRTYVVTERLTFEGSEPLLVDQGSINTHYETGRGGSQDNPLPWEEKVVDLK